MRYHTPVTQNTNSRQLKPNNFVIAGGELVTTQKVYPKEMYPNLPDTMVKVTGSNGQNIFVPISKIKCISTSDL